MKIFVIHGPNLNMLGSREPQIYGMIDMNGLNELISDKAGKSNVLVDFLQSNSEGELISAIHKGLDYDGIILNPAGYGHTSIAMMDAIKAVKTPVIEVHLSNIHTREEFRHQTYTSKASYGVITGFGADSYLMALEALIRIIDREKI